LLSLAVSVPVEAINPNPLSDVLVTCVDVDVDPKISFISSNEAGAELGLGLVLGLVGVKLSLVLLVEVVDQVVSIRSTTGAAWGWVG